MEKIYGPPSTGLRLLHKASHLDLALLLTCRQINSEAALIPYAANTFFFDRDSAKALPTFALALTTKQIAAVKTLQVNRWTLQDIGKAANTFRGLRCLQYYGHDCPCSGFECNIRGRSDVSALPCLQLDKVEVIMEPAEMMGRQIEDGGRQSAEGLEGFLGECFSSE